VTVEELLHHTRAVRRGGAPALLIGTCPSCPNNVSVEQAIANAGRFLKEAGAEAVKVEGGGWVAKTVGAMVEAGIPVVGHLGLTPQTASMLGGYRVQGRTAESARKIFDDALALQEAGAFLLVLECVPDRLGADLEEARDSRHRDRGRPNTDGQVLVFHDLVGIQSGFAPKFVKRYAKLATRSAQPSPGTARR